MFFKRILKNIIYFRNSVFYSTRNQDRRVVVTGVGAVTPFGATADISWTKLLNLQCCIRKIEDKAFETLPCKVAAFIDFQDLKLDKRFLKSERKSLSKATTLALIAAEEAINSAKLHQFIKENSENIGVCVGMGMLDLADIYSSYQALSKGYSKLSPYFIPRILPNMACGQISIKYGLRGPIHTVSTACATGAHAIGDAYRFIKHGDADVMICGSAESCIDPLSFAGFCRLRALSTNFNDTPEKASRPFDEDRDGFVMGEGSAILVLEELEHAKKRSAQIYAEIVGYGLSGDASHMTAPNEDGIGAYLAMKRAVYDAKVKPSEISYINAHATSTPVGDQIEAKAIQDFFGSHSEMLQVSSTKGSHGHLLGASGSIETLFVVLASKHKLLPPSINIVKPIKNMSFNLVQDSQQWNLSNVFNKRIALKNSFGFGGTNACLCIAEFEDM